VDVRLKQRARQLLPLATLREHAAGKLEGMLLLQRGNRLSVTPVDAAHWKFILSLMR
jgi:predicted RNA-binding protein with PUA-like domain